MELSITRRAYNKIKKHGEVFLQSVSVPASLRTQRKVELVFPSRHGKRTMKISAMVLSRSKTGNNLANLTVARIQ